MIKIREYLDYLIERDYHSLSDSVVFAPLQISNLNVIHNKTLIRWHGKDLVKVGYPVTKDVDKWMDIETKEEYDLSALSVYSGLEIIYGELSEIIQFLDGELNIRLNVYIEDKNNFIETGNARAVFENSYNRFADLKNSIFNLTMLYDKISMFNIVERDVEVAREKRLAKENDVVTDTIEMPTPIFEDTQLSGKEACEINTSVEYVSELPSQEGETCEGVQSCTDECMPLNDN